MALSTRGCASDGPGPINILCGGLNMGRSLLDLAMDVGCWVLIEIKLKATNIRGWSYQSYSRSKKRNVDTLSN